MGAADIVAESRLQRGGRPGWLAGRLADWQQAGLVVVVLLLLLWVPASNLSPFPASIFNKQLAHFFTSSSPTTAPQPRTWCWRV